LRLKLCYFFDFKHNFGMEKQRDNRRKNRKERRERRKAFFRHLFELFAKTAAVTFITQYGVWVLIAITVAAIWAATQFWR